MTPDELIAKAVSVSHDTGLIAKQAARLAYEDAAEMLAPKNPRPCDCIRCDCQNVGDWQRVTEWDTDMIAATALRAKAAALKE